MIPKNQAAQVTMIKGFTLIELLVVIAVLGVLASGVVVAINPIKRINEARDAQRLMIMGQIRNALSSYYVLHGNYPPPNSGGDSSCTAGCGDWEVAGCGVPFIKALIDDGDLKTDMIDPTMNGKPTACHNIRYYRYGAGSDGCDSTRGDYYVLGITDMESTGNPHPKSPGWNCGPGNRNWQNEFDWVVGEFQK